MGNGHEGDFGGSCVRTPELFAHLRPGVPAASSGSALSPHGSVLGFVVHGVHRILIDDTIHLVN